MTRLRVLAALFVLLAVMPKGAFAVDQPPIRIGIVYSYTGSAPTAGPALDAAIAAWLSLHHGLVGGRKVEIIRRDDTGPAPDVATRQAQELAVAEHVDFLMGGLFTPNAVAVARVSTAAKVPFFIVNASTNGILTDNPYSFRLGATNQQVTVPLAVWAANQKLKTVFNLIADYATGIQSGAVFADAFTARGGKMAGDLRFPLTSTEFSAYVQRIKDSKADAMFAFVPAGPPSIAFFQASKAAQLRASGIKMIFNPTTVDDLSLAAIGDEALGAISCSQYAWTHKSALNTAFVAAFRRAATGGVQNPDFMSEAAFNVMTAIDRVVAAQTGPLDLDKTLATLKGLQIEGPRGPIQLDAKTREPIENMYIRRVERVNGVLASVEFDTIPHVPGEYK